MESRFNRQSLEEACKRKTGGDREIGKEGTRVASKESRE